MEHNVKQYLRDIIELSTEALNHASAGGGREHAFWLFCNESELSGIAETLADFINDINEELDA